MLKSHQYSYTSTKNKVFQIIVWHFEKLYFLAYFFVMVNWWLGPLPRSPGMGEGGDWWIWPMGVIAEGISRGCHCESIIPRVLGILVTHYQFSIKTLLSKKIKKSEKQKNPYEIWRTANGARRLRGYPLLQMPGSASTWSSIQPRSRRAPLAVRQNSCGFFCFSDFWFFLIVEFLLTAVS